MDNRIFNVNGRTKLQLGFAVKSLLMNEYDKFQSVRSWYYSEKNGFVLCWYKSENKNTKMFTDRMGNPKSIEIDELIDILWSWLQSEDASKVNLNVDEDSLNDSDVTEVKGWRLYNDNFGHIYNSEDNTLDYYSIAALKPMWLQYGK